VAAARALSSLDERDRIERPSVERTGTPGSKPIVTVSGAAGWRSGRR
jgi:hypothetical protein